MTIQEPLDDTTLVRSTPLTVTLVTAAVMTIVVGMWASPFLDWARNASQLLQ